MRGSQSPQQPRSAANNDNKMHKRSPAQDAVDKAGDNDTAGGAPPNGRLNPPPRLRRPKQGNTVGAVTSTTTMTKKTNPRLWWHGLMFITLVTLFLWTYVLRPSDSTARLNRIPTRIERSRPDATTSKSAMDNSKVNIIYNDKDNFKQAIVKQAPLPQPRKPLSTLPRMEHSDTNTTRPLKNRDRPYFIFHIGPPKTATTSFQWAMTEYVEVLKRDSYHYLGQTMRDPTNLFRHDHGPILAVLKNKQCIISTYNWRRHRERQQEAGRQSSNPPPKCWEKVRDLLTEHRAANQSLILSEENFAIKYADLGVGRQAHRDSVDWIALAELLAELDFQPIVLIGYRRLFEIMPSAKQQWDRWTRTQKSLNEWPPEPGREQVNRTGRILQPLFPDVLKDPRLYEEYHPVRIPGTIQWSYTDYLVRVIRPHLPVRLMNMHSATTTGSLRTYFLCHVLPYAPAACAQSTQDDATDPPQVYNQEESLFFDALSCQAALRNWFDTNVFKRHHVNLGLQEYYAKRFPGRNIQKDVPLECPPAEQTNMLLDRSLAKESQLWPEHLVEAWKAEHVAAFEKSVASNKFCWIDVNATLAQQPHWKEWFTSLNSIEDLPVTPRPPPERQGGPRRRQRRPYQTRPTLAPTPSPTIANTAEYDGGEYYDVDDGGDDGGSDSGDYDGGYGIESVT